MHKAVTYFCLCLLILATHDQDHTVLIRAVVSNHPNRVIIRTIYSIEGGTKIPTDKTFTQPEIFLPY